MEKSDKRILAAERQAQALELRKAGYGYAEIAQQLGYRGPQGAHNAVMTALRKMLKEPAEEVRNLELERLDRIYRALYPQALKGNQGAADRCIRIMERRARLLGLDAPTKAEVDNSGKVIVEFTNDWRGQQED